MNHQASPELEAAQRLLSAFESEMSSPGAKAKLSEGLSLLTEIIEADEAEAKVAGNLASAYGAKAAASAEAILEGAVAASPNELYHWDDLLSEFGRCGIESAPVAAALSKVNHRLVSRHVAQMTEGEKRALLRLLEAQLPKEHT